MAGTITISEIVAEFGAKYVKGSQDMKNLQTAIWQKTETDELFGLWPTEDTVAYKATAKITGVLQAFQKAFTKKSDTTFTLEKIPLYHVKIDESIFPDDLMPSWLGFLADGKLKRSDWGIVRYWLEQLIVNRYKADLELNECFKGETGVITPGTATLDGKSLNGIRKTIRDGHTASKTNMITMGAAPTDPVEFVEYVEDFFDQIPELHASRIDSLPMNETFYKRFRRGMRLKYNMAYAQTDITTIIDTDVQVKKLASMTGSDMLWCTMKENKANPQKWAANKGVFDIQVQGREVQALSDWWIGYGFWYLPYVYHTDQDLS